MLVSVAQTFQYQFTVFARVICAGLFNLNRSWGFPQPLSLSPKEGIMNNNDLFKIEINKGNFLKAARLACHFGAGKGSRAGAWSWADEAVAAAAKAGIKLDCGNLSWPDFGAMLKQLGEE